MCECVCTVRCVWVLVCLSACVCMWMFVFSAMCVGVSVLERYSDGGGGARDAVYARHHPETWSLVFRLQQRVWVLVCLSACEWV